VCLRSWKRKSAMPARRFALSQAVELCWMRRPEKVRRRSTNAGAVPTSIRAPPADDLIFLHPDALITSQLITSAFGDDGRTRRYTPDFLVWRGVQSDRCLPLCARRGGDQ
jgi:hypothetical protein